MEQKYSPLNLSSVSLLDQVLFFPFVKYVFFSDTSSTYLVKQRLDFKLCALYLYFLSIIHFLNDIFPIFVPIV